MHNSEKSAATKAAKKEAAEAARREAVMKKKTEDMKKTVDELTQHAAMKRSTVSEATQDLLRFIQAHEQNDPLINKDKNKWKQNQPGKCGTQ